MQFLPFPKMARLNREIIVTEKIDGINAQIIIDDATISEREPIAIVHGLGIWAGSRTKFITPNDDNFGFAAWVRNNAEELIGLGTGRHFGEWWGRGIQRGYGLEERKFSLFNASRWKTAASSAEGFDTLPGCCGVVPILYKGPFSEHHIREARNSLGVHGSVAAPGFMKPEGIVVFHTAANAGFKVTLENDDVPKGVLQ